MPKARVELTCGRECLFSSVATAPSVGDLVPCLEHGYCRVVLSGPIKASKPNSSLRRPRRTVEDLLTHLAQNRTQSLQQMRRAGFTLRVVSMAAQSGQVQILDDGEHVEVRLPDHVQPPH